MNEHAGHRQRLRETYLKKGVEGMADHQVLELLLTFAIPRKDVNPIGHALIDHFGSLDAVLDATQDDLMQVPGVGENSALLLSMMGPLFQKYSMSRMHKKNIVLSDPAAVKEYCVAMMRDVRDEEFVVLSFNQQLRLLAADRLAKGVPDQVAVYPRKVVEILIRRGATAAIICHNHPGGSTRPSQSDIALTEAIKAALNTVSIRLNDHILVAGGQGHSFHEMGLM